MSNKTWLEEVEIKVYCRKGKLMEKERGIKKEKLIQNRHVYIHSPNLRKSLYRQYIYFRIKSNINKNTILTSLYWQNNASCTRLYEKNRMDNIMKIWYTKRILQNGSVWCLISLLTYLYTVGSIIQMLSSNTVIKEKKWFNCSVWIQYFLLWQNLCLQ